ncbi:MAG: Lrp/AsnC family transcriptional regulator [Nanobdellota archaeon]
MKQDYEKDMRLISWLRTNSRLPLTKISKGTNIPISTLFDKLKEQEKDLVFKHTTLIDFSKLGYYTKVHLLLKTPTKHKKELEKHLKCNDKINSIYKVTEKYHFLVEGIFKHVKDFNTFLEVLEERFSPLEYSSHFITEDVKREAFLAEESVPYGVKRAS